MNADNHPFCIIKPSRAKWDEIMKCQRSCSVFALVALQQVIKKFGLLRGRHTDMVSKLENVLLSCSANCGNWR